MNPSAEGQIQSIRNSRHSRLEHSEHSENFLFFYNSCLPLFETTKSNHSQIWLHHGRLRFRLIPAAHRSTSSTDNVIQQYDFYSQFVALFEIIIFWLYLIIFVAWFFIDFDCISSKNRLYLIKKSSIQKASFCVLIQHTFCILEHNASIIKYHHKDTHT